jgi:hypothetical protein
MPNYESYRGSTRVLARPAYKPASLADDPAWVGRDEAARLLGCSTSTVTSRRQSGALQGYKATGEVLAPEDRWAGAACYYYRADLEEKAAEQEEKAAERVRVDALNAGRVTSSEAAVLLGVTTRLITDLREAGVLTAYEAATGEPGRPGRGGLYDELDLERVAAHPAVARFHAYLDSLRRWA